MMPEEGNGDYRLSNRCGAHPDRQIQKLSLIIKKTKSLRRRHQR